MRSRSGMLLGLSILALCAFVGCFISAPKKRPPAKKYVPSAHVNAETAESCADHWLVLHGLDSFGNPPNTSYRGGTPLFDEQTGQMVPRLRYLYAHHPDLKAACDGVKPDGGAKAGGSPIR